MQDRPTLCWRCAKACGECSWSADFIPVDGWDAETTIIKADSGVLGTRDVPSYLVKKCPLFTDDSARYKSKPVIIGGDPEKRIIRKPFRARVKKGSLREKIWNMPDLNERIHRLTGNGRTAAEMIFLYNNTIEDISDYLYVSSDAAKMILQRAMQQMEAMA